METDEFLDIPEFKKDVRDLKSRLKITPSFLQSTYIVVLAVHRIPDANRLHRISCSRGLPIGGYVYDTVNDAYSIHCDDHLLLGYVPISFKAQMDGSGQWETYVPLPENIISRYLRSQQKADLRGFKSKYKADSHDYHYLQLIGSD